MTIAVARFVSALPANPAAASAVTPTEAGGTGSSIVAGDFASLLLGQMMPGLIPAETATTAKQDGKIDELATDAIPITDSAQLFANLGLPVPAAMPTEPPTVAVPLIVTSGGEGMAASSGTPSLQTGTADNSNAWATASITELGGRMTAAATDPSAAATVSSVAATIPTTAKEISVASNNAAQASGIEMQSPSFTLPEPKLPAKVAAVEESAAELTHQTGTSIAGNTAPMPALHASAPSAPAENPSLRLATPVRDAAWPADFSQKVVWIARQDLQSAQITLNPPQLGPIEVSLDIKNEQATAIFVSANPEVREAIESSLPRLREMLAGVGVELGQANVSHESFRQAGEQGNSGRHASDAGNRQPAGGGTQQTGIMATGAAQLRTGRGLVDTFA